jgi:DNA ligase (NAD+)
VIPYVVGPVVGARAGLERPIYPPERCPVCDSLVERDAGEVAYYCSNPACPERVARNIEYFVSRSAMDIEGLGESGVRQLLNEGLIRDEADIFSLRLDDLLPLEGFAEKKARNLLASIEAAKQRPLARLIGALGIRGVGNTVAELLVKHYFSIDDLARASSDALQGIEGLGPHTARAIVTWFEQPRNQMLIEKFRAAGLRLEESPPEADAQMANELAGLTFVLTGTLPTLKRNEAIVLIEKHGGKVTGSVSKKTSYVVAGEDPGSKFAMARELGIPIIDEDALLKLMDERYG